MSTDVFQWVVVIGLGLLTLGIYEIHIAQKNTYEEMQRIREHLEDQNDEYDAEEGI